MTEAELAYLCAVEPLPVPLDKLPDLARRMLPATKKLFARIKRDRHLADRLDDQLHDIHFEVFDRTDCLACANCCKTTSPRITDRDIDRLAVATRMKPGDFVQKYLKIDRDNDWVFQSTPCPMLGPDNYCSVYEDRPTACREYPHTDRKRQVQILDLTARNTEVCPAVFAIVERLKEVLDR